MLTGPTLSRDSDKPSAATGLSSFVAWNGLQLHVPDDWDVHVGGPRHLVFEKEFHPQAQIRWERENRRISSQADHKLTAAISQFGSVLSELPAAWLQLSEKFCHVTGYRQANGLPGGLYCLCPKCKTIVLVQLLTADLTVMERIATCLLTLACHPPGQTLWRIQDFSLRTPDSFSLSDYTFGAGLTRLSFCKDELSLHACRIGPADDRLRQQSLENLLLTLSGTADLEVAMKDDTICQGYRRPSTGRQLLFRIRREKPFLWAQIRHDRANNRLLAVILASKHPIPEETADNICAHYEIV